MGDKPGSATIKLEISNTDYTLYIYRREEKIIFELVPNDPEDNYSGGMVTGLFEEVFSGLKRLAEMN
jgi:hypothetical protein